MSLRNIFKSSLPQELGDGRLDLIISIFDHLKKAPPQKRKIILDWHKVQKITPAGYAILACLFDRITEQGFALQVTSFSKKTIPLSPVLNNLLKFKTHSNTLPKPSIHDHQDESYILCGGETSINLNFIEKIKKQYAHLLSEDHLFSCQLIINELMQNSIDHSSSERYYLYAGPFNKEFHFGVLDMGVSIPAKLEQKYSNKNDIDHLTLALKKGSSTRRIRQGGLGLHYTFDILKGYNGRLTIISRHAQIRRYFKSKTIHRRFLNKPLNGTWCFARFPIKD